MKNRSIKLGRFFIFFLSKIHILFILPSLYLCYAKYDLLTG
jgi:hypothetical protein